MPCLSSTIPQISDYNETKSGLWTDGVGIKCELLARLCFSIKGSTEVTVVVVTEGFVFRGEVVK